MPRAPSRRRRRRRPEGCVGAGTGMVALGWKGGIGSSSRVVPERRGDGRRARARELRLGAATSGSTACRCSRRSATASTRGLRRGAASPSSQPTRRSSLRSSSASPGAPGSASRGPARSPITAAARSSSPSRPRRSSATSLRRCESSGRRCPTAPRPALRRRRRGDRGGSAQRALGGGRHGGPKRADRPRATARAGARAAARARPAAADAALQPSGAGDPPHEPDARRSRRSRSRRTRAGAGPTTCGPFFASTPTIDEPTRPPSTISATAIRLTAWSMW